MTYNHKVEIHVLTESVDDIGQMIQQWEKKHSCWASISHIGAREYYKAAQTNSQNDIRICIRYSKQLSGYSPQDIRVKYNSKYYDVKSISDYMEKHMELEFRCSEIRRTEER